MEEAVEVGVPALTASVGGWWRDTRFHHWQHEGQASESGLGAALLRLSVASLLHRRLSTAAPYLPDSDIVGLVGAAISSAVGFLGVMAGHSNWVLSAQFSPDGQNIVSASSDRTVRVWSAATGECVQTLAGHGDWVNSVQFSPDGQSIVSASFDKTVRVWDLRVLKDVRDL